MTKVGKCPKCRKRSLMEVSENEVIGITQCDKVSLRGEDRMTIRVCSVC
jgi:hypothetical protein